MYDRPCVNILTIAGSDPSGGAGIQRDVLTFAAFGCRGLSVVTAITAQGPAGFYASSPVSRKVISDQLDAVLSEFRVDAVKIGMVFDSPAIKAIHRGISGLDVPVVVDPVIRSTTGGVLLDPGAIKDYQRYVVPVASIMTPNLDELTAISGIARSGSGDYTARGARKLMEMGADGVVVTGTRDGQSVRDRVFLKDREFTLQQEIIPVEAHGSGCSYSAALAASLAGANTDDAIRAARRFAVDMIRGSVPAADGSMMVGEAARGDGATELAGAVARFTRMQDAWRYIPECQTNFVFAKNRPRSINDILGLSGRIVRVGTDAVAVGPIRAGGSKHVATAVLCANRMFPSIRAGINIRFSYDTVARIKNAGMSVARYDRRNEPDGIKSEGSSIAWGIESALGQADSSYDAIYHDGDWGKEAMIILFGTDPYDTLDKVAGIARADHIERTGRMPASK